MFTLVHRLFFFLATATEPDLCRYIQFLKSENEILHSRIEKRIRLTPAERTRLIKLGLPLGSAIKDLITIVTPQTFLRWVKERKNPHFRNSPKSRSGPRRPQTKDDIRRLIVGMAGETGWGYTRILGELHKLGIHTVSRSTVVNILKEHGFDPGPKRGEGTWDEFVKRHASTLWACDFLSVRSLTMRGLLSIREFRGYRGFRWSVDLYLLLFINTCTWKVVISPATRHPNGEWVSQQARNFCMAHEKGDPERPKFLIRDRDAKYLCLFDRILEDEEIEVIQLPVRSPNLNAVAERFVQTLKVECLNHFIILGEQHLNHLVHEFMEYYHTQRPHQSLGNRPLTTASIRGDRIRGSPEGEILCEERLGGLLKHYYRAAA